MSHAFFDLAFTPQVRAMQTRQGSRDAYSRFDDGEPAQRGKLGPREATFIAERDGFYQATVGETGWPYVQFRGGLKGFLQVLDEQHIAYADFRGNVQYISSGNLQGNDRVALILMDYARQERLKILGRARLITMDEDPALMGRLRHPGYDGMVERAVVITVEAFDWNCPKHITPRYTEAEVQALMAPLQARAAQAEAALALSQAASTQATVLGHGPLKLTISAVRQLTPRVRAYELQDATGKPLPPSEPGAHLALPIPMPDGSLQHRRYSLGPALHTPGAWEVAVLRQERAAAATSSASAPTGSAALHDRYQLGQQLAVAQPRSHFELHTDHRPAIFIAGGIGITPLRSMAYALRDRGVPFHLHWAVRRVSDAAYAGELSQQLGPRLTVYASDAGERLDLSAILAKAAPQALVYVCGPDGLMAQAREQAQARGIADERVRLERFAPAPASTPHRPVTLKLARSGKSVAASAETSLLDAALAAGAVVPSSCRTGQCGTCAVRVLDGVVDHRDHVLTDEARSSQGLICLCVSRALSDTLTLDL